MRWAGERPGRRGGTAEVAEGLTQMKAAIAARLSRLQQRLTKFEASNKAYDF